MRAAIPLLLAAIALAATPALAQNFSGPATITQPTTANDCVKISSGNQLVDAGVSCGTPTAVGANPTATIGASAVNGTSANFMRADAAPPLPATLPALSGVNLTALNGSNVASGTVAVARLPTGTSGAALPLLNGNNSWSGTVTYSALPTSDPHVAGQLWNNAGVLSVSAG